MPTLQEIVDGSGERVGVDELVNFGSCERDEINPSTGRRSYWFRFGDICGMTLPQIQAAIGQLASAGLPSGATTMRVSALPRRAFTRRPGPSFFGLDEFSIDAPVLVKCNIRVG
jgi:hypothetical protein